MEENIKEILITEDELKQKTKELGIIISNEYKGKVPLMIGVLKGAVIFMSDLIRNINIDVEIDFMAVSSYGASTQSSGVVRIVKDLDTTIDKRDVIIVEDIIDSGLTLSYLIDLFIRRNVNSIKVVTLLDKPHNRMVNLEPDFIGFTIPDEFVEIYPILGY